jgi:hypothetical protein
MAMASLWTLWHVPAFFTPGMPHQFIPKVPFLIAIVSFGVFLALVFNEGGESILPTIAAHVALNIMLAIGGVEISSTAFWWSLAAMNGAIAVLALARLTRRDQVGAVESATA